MVGVQYGMVMKSRLLGSSLLQDQEKLSQLLWLQAGDNSSAPFAGLGGSSKPHPPGHLQHAPGSGRAPWLFAPIMSDAQPYNRCPPENEQSGPDPGQDSDAAPPPSKAGVHTDRFCI